MIKKNGLWDTLNYYNVIPFTIITGVIIYFREYLVTYFCLYNNIKANNQFYPFLHSAIPAGALILLIVFFFMNVRNKRYAFLTGRKYVYDSGHYNRGYAELVDYFKDAEPHKLDTSIFPYHIWKDTKGLIFGLDDGRLVSIPSNSECNIAVFGPPGAGKTSGIAIINAMQFEGSVLAIDIKGEFDINDIFQAIHNISSSTFLLKGNDKWHLTFDWFIKIENFSKVLKNQYADYKSGNAKSTKNMSTEEYLRATAGW